jgi:hypothetical protein
MKKSNIKDCIIVVNKNQKKPMFYFPSDIKEPGDCYVNLIGYAIIPIKEYNNLKKAAGKI